jgi:hypothetical protein
VIDFPAGTKAWINVSVRTVRTGKRIGEHYLAVSLNPYNPPEGSAKS